MLRYVRSDSVVSRVIAGETLVIPVRKGVGDLASIYSLNPVATAVWQSIATPSTKDDIVSAIEQEFDAQGSHVAQDVETFLSEMDSAGLVNVTGVAE
jgi:hypothetical protein